MLQKLKNKLAALDFAGDQAFSDEERALCRTALVAKDHELAHNTIKLGVAFNAALLILVPLLVPDPDYIRALMSASTICLAVDLAWVLGHKYQRLIKPHVVVLLFNLVLITAFSYVIGLSSIQGKDGAFVTGTSTLITLASVLIILSPFSNYLTPLSAGLFWLVTFHFYPPRIETGRWLMIYAVSLIFACIIRQGQTRRVRRETVLEHRRREAEIRAAKAKFQRELELAREIQDSMAPPPYQATPEGLQVYCMQLKHEKIAGDWMTVRHLSDGSLIIVIADATGKGLQAALVVHAIQSLWATTLDQPGFDPKDWLERVNLALYRLGEKQAHSATVGVAVLTQSRITYWSAGHLPLFLLLGTGQDALLKTLLSRGNVLGLSNSIQISGHYIDLAPNYPVRILMGSDGVFDKGTLTQSHDVEAIYEHVKTEGASCLSRFTPADDKTLIVVEKNYDVSKVA